MRRSALAVIAGIAAYGCAPSIDRSAEEEALLALHERVLEAHRTGNVSDWMATEADTMISANRGTISFSTASERREMRQRYLGATTFATYRDLQPPIVRISEDGTLGWVIAEVEVKGSRRLDSGGDVPVDAVWAWIELYEKRAGAWRAIGNVSNRRP